MKSKNNVLITILKNRSLTLLVIIVLITLVMSILFPRSFFSFYNLKTVLLNLSVEGTLAVGMMFLLIAGVFDLSVGSNLACSAAVMAIILKSFPSFPLIPAVLLGVATGSLAGLVNGYLVKAGVNALIATLATMGILRGVALLLLGVNVKLPESLFGLGQTVIFGIQIPVFYMIGIVVAGALVLAKTKFFRQIYYVGANRKAAVLSGIPADRIIIILFVLMGTIAGFVGAVLAAQLRAAVAQIGNGVELRVISAVIIGGGSLTGGKGTVIGAFLGALFIVLLGTVMIIAGVSIYLQNIIVGLVLIGAVTLDAVLQKKYGIMA